MEFVKIADAINTYDYAIDKLIQWGYEISMVNDMTDSIDKFILIAEKQFGEMSRGK